jgi:hypothetical protein
MVKKVISKEVKVKRVDTNLKLKKAPTKSELELQVKDLLQANDALEKSNRQKIELLESFGGKIEKLEINRLFILKLRQKLELIQNVMNATSKQKVKEN